jgi:hypothetical protein
MRRVNMRRGWESAAAANLLMWAFPAEAPMSYDPHRSRSSKVFTSLEGFDEFSVYSVEPDPNVKTVNLQSEAVAAEGQPQQLDDGGLFMRLFKKMFRG